jgi:O-antigen ligase
MLLYISLVGAAIALLFFIINPAVGVLLIFLVRPFVDTAYGDDLGVGLRLTEIVSVIVPCLIILHMTTAKGFARFRYMPLNTIWLIWTADVVLFSSLIMFQEGMLAGLTILFRHLNGFAGFFMVQAFLREGKGPRNFFLILMLAGLFPTGIGVYQILTGAEWKVTYAEGIVRNIGLYHDAITPRYYAMQTILGITLFTALHLRKALLKQALAVLFAILAVAVMFKTYSKSGIATLGLWFLEWTALQRKIMLLVLASFALIIFSTYYSSELIGHVEQLFNKEISAVEGTGQVQRTFAGRWYIWDQLWSDWQRLPFLGKIFGAGRIALGAHNDYLQILFQGGILGVSIYIVLLIIVGWSLVRNLFKKVDPLAVAALMAFTMWLIDTVGLVPSAYSGYQWFVWGVIGLSLRLRQDALRQARNT